MPSTPLRLYAVIFYLVHDFFLYSRSPFSTPEYSRVILSDGQDIKACDLKTELSALIQVKGIYRVTTCYSALSTASGPESDGGSQ